MAGGVHETDNEKLAKSCENFMTGAKKLYDEQGEKADMWLFELYHHLEDCAAALRIAEFMKEPEPPHGVRYNMSGSKD